MITRHRVRQMRTSRVFIGGPASGSWATKSPLASGDNSATPSVYAGDALQERGQGGRARG